MDDSSNRKVDDNILRPAGIPGQRPISSVRQRSSKTNRLVGAVVALVLVVGLALGVRFVLGMGAGVAEIKTNGYQAVFLTNGQVYFGKLSNARGEYLNMNSIYYLQVQQAVQPGGDSNAAPATADESADNVKLVKLGNELHGPEDKMSISSKQVLFWENLKSDGKVSQAIEKYKAENK